MRLHSPSPRAVPRNRFSLPSEWPSLEIQFTQPPISGVPSTRCTADICRLPSTIAHSIPAGPAGMECAMVLGKRQMSAVHLVDGTPEIGGCVNWISKLGHSDGKENLFRGTARGLGEWSRIVNYRQVQLDKLKNV